MISKKALKTAFKMLETIGNQYGMPGQEQDLLLNLITAISLQDLLEDGTIRWKTEPPSGLRLAMAPGGARTEGDRSRAALIRAQCSEEEIESAYEQAEELLEARGLPEAERAALFTALPCLGLSALGAYLEWRSAPPFPEVL